MRRGSWPWLLGVTAWLVAASCSESTSGMPKPTALDGSADVSGPPPPDAADAPIANQITLTASSTSVTAAGDVVLRATFTGMTPTSIEFLDGTRSLGTDSAAPYEQTVSFTTADNGAHSCVAKATYPNGGGISPPVIITVNVPDDSVYVDPTLGVDTNAGTKPAPVKTIQKAAQMVKAGQAVVLADGTYDLQNQTTLDINFLVTAAVRGASATGVVLRGNGTTTGFAFAKGGEVRDVGFEDFGAAIHVGGGAFKTSGVRFANVGLPFYFNGDTKATVDVSGVPTFLTKVPASGLGFCLMVVDGTSEVAWKGGIVAGVTGALSGALVRGAGKLGIDGLTIKDLPGHAFVVYDNGKLALKNVVIQGSGLGTSSGPDKAVIAMGGQNTQQPLAEALELDGTEISSGRGPAIVMSLYGLIASTPTFKLSNSHIDGNAGPGLWVISPGNLAPALTVTIDVSNTTFKGNQGNGILAARGSVSITGGEVWNNMGAGIQLDDAASTNALKVRGTTFTGNLGDAIHFAGAAGSTLDLGKTGDDGKLVFSAVAAGAAAVHLEAPLRGLAVGNTWVATQQGASADGKYAAATTLTGPVMGTNVTLAAGASLVLAE